jgi:hypothetical protein
METDRSIDHLFFGFRNSLEMKQVLGPGRHHYLDMEVVGSGGIRKQLPAVSPISQMNQPKLVHETVELAPSSFVHLEVNCNEYRPVSGLRNVNEILWQGIDRSTFEAEPLGKIDW